MFDKRIKILKLPGFEVNINLSLIILAVLTTWSLAEGLFPYNYSGLPKVTYWLMGAVGALGLFISILAHEFYHSVVARKFGTPMKGITLSIFGSVAEMGDEPRTAKAEFAIAIVGPISSLVIAGVFFLIYREGVSSDWGKPVNGVIYYLAYFNAILAVFNLLPAFPLDGGRVLRSILWDKKGDLLWATRVSSTIGSAFGVGLIVLGILQFIMGNIFGGMWFFYLGLFLRSAAQMFYQQQKNAREHEILWTFAFLKEKLRMALSTPVLRMTLSTPARGDITRYLAASALLLGSWFRRQWLDYASEKHKAVAPELGVDLPLLIKVCKYLEDRETRFHVIFFVISLCFLFVCLVAFRLYLYYSEERIIIFASVFLVAAWIVRAYKGHVEKAWALRLFQYDKYDPDVVSKEFNTTDDPEISSTLKQNDYNLIIYSGFVPFVGAGIDLGGWSLAVDITRPKQEIGRKADVQQFSTEDLYAELDRSLSQMRISGLKTQDALFVNGKAIRDEKWILADIYDPPINRVDAETIKRFIGTSDPRIRHYLWVQVHGWADQLVVSYFLRFSLQGKNLFIDVSAFLLTPIADQYCGIDELISPDWRRRVLSSVGYLFITPFTVLYSWFALFVKFYKFGANHIGASERKICKKIKNTPLFDYGAESSLRVKMSSSNFNHFFQRSDSEMYFKIIERALIDSIVNFLDDHNIDTSDLKERRTTIINSGIIVQGGDVRAQAMAVGTAAQAATGRRTSE